MNTLDEFNQDIVKIKTLEQRVQTLEEELAYFNLVFPSYADAINILKARIEILESKL